MDQPVIGAVYITEVTRRNYDDAKVYGELKAITRRNALLSEFDPETLKDRVMEALKNFDFDLDHLLLDGSPLTASMSILALAVQDAPVPVLMWDEKLKDFIEIEVIASEYKS